LAARSCPATLSTRMLISPPRWIGAPAPHPRS
jgi:hypothetical protein